jgi:hypothetical protein
MELNGLGHYNGGQIAPIGTFVNLRTFEFFQQASDGALPADGDFYFLSQTSNLSASAIAAAVNNILGTSYTSSNFHAHGSPDLATSQGTGANDA